MKTFLLIATAAATVAIFSPSADARDRYDRPLSQYSDAELQQYVELYERRARRLSRQVESHETVRANAADPTRQYDLPDWARAAFAPRGRR